MKTFTFIVTVILFSLIFTTCKKYPDGGYLKRAPKVIEGTYNLELFEVNGIDSTELINLSNSSHYKQVIIYNNAGALSCNYSRFSCSVTFVNNNKQLKLISLGKSNTECVPCGNQSCCFRSYLTPNPPISSSQVSLNTVYWEILKLNNKEMIITLNKIHNYKIKLKKVGGTP